MSNVGKKVHKLMVGTAKVWSGTAAPTHSATQGDLYIRTGSGSDPNVSLYQNIDGSTSWLPMHTAESAITDPGNAGAIPVTKSGVCPIVTAGAETRTLAIPTFIGQRVTLYFQTDGGNGVITVAAAVNRAGNNTITLADVNESITLEGVTNGSTLAWRVGQSDFNTGGLSTV